MIVFVALSPSLDVTYEVPRLAIGGITRPTGVTRVAGGKALNAARVACALGTPVHVVTALGGPAGEWIAQLLRDERVRCSAMTIAGASRMCLAVVDESGTPTSTDIYESAPALSSTEWKRFADLARTVVATSAPRWLGVSGSVPDGVPYEQLSALIHGKHARVALDLSGAALRDTVRPGDLVKINRAEAETALGLDLADAREACRLLRTRLEVDAVVTDGVRPGFAMVDDVAATLASPQRLGRFPAGSGDAFFAGLLVTLDAGGDVRDAIETARVVAERNARAPGQGRLADPLDNRWE